MSTIDPNSPAQNINPNQEPIPKGTTRKFSTKSDKDNTENTTLPKGPHELVAGQSKTKESTKAEDHKFEKDMAMGVAQQTAQQSEQGQSQINKKLQNKDN